MPNWFIIDEHGYKHGAFDKQQLKALANQGKITPDTLLETGGRKGYAKQIPGLFDPPSPQPVVVQKNKYTPSQVVPATKAKMNETLFVVIVVVIFASIAFGGIAGLFLACERSAATRQAEQAEREAADIAATIDKAKQEKEKLDTLIAHAEQEKKKINDALVIVERVKEAFGDAIISKTTQEQKRCEIAIADAVQEQEQYEAAIDDAKQERRKIESIIRHAERERTKIDDTTIANTTREQENLKVVIAKIKQVQTTIAKAERDWLVTLRREQERERERIAAEQKEREERARIAAEQREQAERQKLAAEQARQRIAEQQRIAAELQTPDGRRKHFVRVYVDIKPGETKITELFDRFRDFPESPTLQMNVSNEYESTHGRYATYRWSLMEDRGAGVTTFHHINLSTHNSVITSKSCDTQVRTRQDVLDRLRAVPVQIW